MKRALYWVAWIGWALLAFRIARDGWAVVLFEPRYSLVNGLLATLVVVWFLQLHDRKQ